MQRIWSRARPSAVVYVRMGRRVACRTLNAYSPDAHHKSNFRTATPSYDGRKPGTVSNFRPVFAGNSVTVPGFAHGRYARAFVAPQNGKAPTLCPSLSSGVVRVGVLDKSQEIRTVSVKDHGRLAGAVDGDPVRHTAAVKGRAGRGRCVPGDTGPASRGGAPGGVAVGVRYAPKHNGSACRAHRVIEVVWKLVRAGDRRDLPPGIRGEIAVHRPRRGWNGRDDRQRGRKRTF